MCAVWFATTLREQSPDSLGADAFEAIRRLSPLRSASSSARGLSVRVMLSSRCTSVARNVPLHNIRPDASTPSSTADTEKSREPNGCRYISASPDRPQQLELSWRSADHVALDIDVRAHAGTSVVSGHDRRYACR
jgi:hypothetical protein